LRCDHTVTIDLAHRDAFNLAYLNTLAYPDADAYNLTFTLAFTLAYNLTLTLALASGQGERAGQEGVVAAARCQHNGVP
jgi:hypothetical protein